MPENMKTIYDIIKESGAEQGVDVMWETTRVISDAIEHDMPEGARHKLYAALYGHLSKGHYNEGYAEEAVKKMYYTDKDGKKHEAPYWDVQTVRDWYEPVKAKIPNYNFWDYYVTANMIGSDMSNLIKEWFEDSTPEEREEKYAAMTLNWLHDEDWPKHDKIWHYLNG